MKNTILNALELFQIMQINSDILMKILVNAQNDAGGSIMLKFSEDSTYLWTIEEILKTIWGHNKEDKQFLYECIDIATKNPENFTVII